MIYRKIISEYLRLLNQFPAVAILGARQVGKTTLAKEISKKIKKETLYLDIERDSDRIKLSDAESYLEKNNDKCIIIDEIQHMPHLFTLLRPLIDAQRIPNRFLLLGSASPRLVKGISESLAGRIAYLELPQINLLEAEHHKINQDLHWFRGGFPEALTAKNNGIFNLWSENFMHSFIERELAELFGTALPTVTIRNFFSMLAGTTGGIWNAENYARSLGITAPTVKHYLDYLEAAFLVHRLPAWSVNAVKRVVKSPKVYLRCSGMVHKLNKIDSFDALNGHIIVGASWEGYVIEQVLELKPKNIDLFYYRTQQGAECDLLLVNGMQPVACIEIKYSNAPHISKGFHSCISDMKTKSNFIITPSSATYDIHRGVTCCSLRNFIKQYLQEL